MEGRKVLGLETDEHIELNLNMPLGLFTDHRHKAH